MRVRACRAGSERRASRAARAGGAVARHAAVTDQPGSRPGPEPVRGGGDALTRIETGCDIPRANAWASAGATPSGLRGAGETGRRRLVERCYLAGCSRVPDAAG